MYSFKPLQFIFTTHLRKRFCERVLELSKRTDLDEYERKNRWSLNLELKKRMQGSVVIDKTELDSIFLEYLKTHYKKDNFVFYLNGKVIFVGIQEEVPVFVTCFKKDGIVGEFYFKDLYSKYLSTGKI